MLKFAGRALRLISKPRIQGTILSLSLLVCVSSAHAQTTFLARQLNRLDVGVGADAIITKSVSGTNYQNLPVQLDASTTVGALVQVRYTKSPLLGAEFNYSYARFTESYSGSPFAGDASNSVPFGVQTNASEYTVGYVAHLPTLFGVQPFAAVGAGTTAFKPTKLGGQPGLYERARATYYYDIGVDDQFTRFFGVRAQFRQSFYKAPDFGANYLAIGKQTFTSEPTIGFYVRF